MEIFCRQKILKTPSYFNLQEILTEIGDTKNADALFSTLPQSTYNRVGIKPVSVSDLTWITLM